MSDFRDIEVKSSNQSLIISLVIGLLTLLLLLITFTFEDTYPKFQPIEIAMNFGNSDVGQGEAEPAPAKTQESSAPSQPQVTQPQQKVATPIKNVATQNTNETRPTASKDNKPKTKPQPKAKTNPKPSPKPKPKGDAKGNSALNSILGGKGKSNSAGQGNDGVKGNIGDPKGSDSNGTSIGENWKSRIPEPQSHNCNASGVIVVDIVVNANGTIKSARGGARGSSSNDACLKQKAEQLVRKYVRAHPGKAGRRGSYKVNLR